MRNFEENENALSSNVSSSVMRVNNIKRNQIKGKSNRPIICYSCGVDEHKSNECRKQNNSKWCKFCRSITHTDKTCGKQQYNEKANHVQDNVSEVKPPSFVFTVSQNDGSHPRRWIPYYYGATSRIVIDNSNFVKIDGKFKPEKHIELADGIQENNIALKRGTVRMNITDSISHDSLLENALYTIISSKYIFGARC